MISAAEQEYNEAERGQHRETLIWLTVRDRSTGEPVEIGYWTGPDDREFTIGGDARVYFGAGVALDVDDIEGGIGLDVRYVSAQLAIRSDAEQAVRTYDPKLAPVEIHSAAFDLDSGALVDEPRRIFLGEVNEAEINIPPDGGDGAIELRMASSARALTKTLPLYKSDAEMKRRGEAASLGFPDRFRQWVAKTGLLAIGWGEEVRKHDE